MTAGERASVMLPAGLRERVLAASAQARPPGHWIGENAAVPPAEAFSRAADALHALLQGLPDRDWQRVVLRGLDVRGLAGHLIGVEADMHSCLSGDPAVAGADHVGSTQPAAARQSGRPPAQIRADWRSAIDRTLTLVRAAGTTDAELALHGMRLPLPDLLVARAFELWTHDNDIRRAAGLPPSVPDPPTLRRMTELAARLLPRGAAATGLGRALRLRLVLTGPGGGSWDIPIGDAGPGSPAIRIVTDAVGFCRLVANRIAPADLDLQATGAKELTAAVLAGAAALALD